MNRQTIRLGIIGAGKVTVGKNRHLDSIRSLEDRQAQVLAIADISADAVRYAADKFQIPHAFTDYHQLLFMPEIDAVAINTPTNTHKQIALDAIRAGKHVYVEKPITQTAAELEQVLAEAKKSDRIFLAGSNGLLQRQMLLFRQFIESGQMGQVYLVSVDRCSSRAQEYGMQKDSAIDKTGAYPKKGTGISSHSGSHNVEWALFLLGDPKPVSVQAKGYVQRHSLDFSGQMSQHDDDTCVATVYFDNGSMFLFKALRAAPGKDMYEMQIYGDQMSLFYDVLSCYKKQTDDCIRLYRSDSLLGMEEISPGITCGKSHADMYSHFFDCIRSGKRPISNGDRGLVTMKILDAMTQSIADGGRQILL